MTTEKGLEDVSVHARILIVEDSEADAELLKRHLSVAFEQSITCVRVKTLHDAIEALNRTDQPFDVILLDLTLPDSVGVSTLSRIQPHASSAAVIVVSGQADAQHMVLLQGATDFAHKGDYQRIVTQIIQNLQLQRQDRQQFNRLSRGLDSVARGFAELRAENASQSETMNELSESVGRLSTAVDRFTHTIEGRDGVDDRLTELENWRTAVTSAIRWTVRCVTGASVAAAIAAIFAKIFGGSTS